jgi:hypothetical protein
MNANRYKSTARTEINRLKKSLTDLYDRCNQLDSSSEISGDMNRYLCVRVSGFLEQSLLAAARSLCEKRSSGEALRFSLSWLERAPNPRADEIIKLVSRFDSKWAQELEILLSEDERRTRVNSLLGIRNDIAHGKNQGVSKRQALEYYNLVVEIIDWVLDRFEPLPGRQ